jgi:hypothetical protein
LKVNVLLADKGKTNPQAGTLDLLNAGWSQTSPTPSPMGQVVPPQVVAIFFEVDRHLCNRDITLLVELVDEDGGAVALPGPAGPQPMRIEQHIRVPIPPLLPGGAPGSGNLLLELMPGPPLAPGVYTWRVTLNGEHRDDWTATFYVLPPPEAPTFGVARPAETTE